jgi:pimeloyl-ACP methyl ester carboxylesterase
LASGSLPTCGFSPSTCEGTPSGDKPPSGYGVEQHVGDLLELIDALALEKPILLGHSIGGAIATFAAEAGRPDRRIGPLRRGRCESPFRRERLVRRG